MGSMNADALIDAFVQKINSSPRRRIREEDIPHPLRGDKAEFGLYYDWTIQRFNHVNWISPLEALLPKPLPQAYKSLVSRFIFPAFHVESLILLANTGQTLYHEMSMAMVHDKVLSKILLSNGYAWFARPDSGDADPVCFDFNRPTPLGDYPLVRISHHHIIFNDTVKITDEYAPSFSTFIEYYLEQQPDAIPTAP